MPATATEAPAESLSRQIYLHVREGIIRGQYPQGSRLAEQRLAQELHISRVPLREAVPLLAVDGFLVSLPRRGSVVTTWTLAMAHHLFDLRLALEVGAARFAAREVGRGRPVDPLRQVLEWSKEGLVTDDAYRVASDSTLFHETVVDLTDNQLMRSVMRSVSGRMMWLFYLTRQLDPLDALEGHEELLAAIASGNERVAEAVAYAHIERDRDESMQVLDLSLRGIS